MAKDSKVSYHYYLSKLINVSLTLHLEQLLQVGERERERQREIERETEKRQTDREIEGERDREREREREREKDAVRQIKPRRKPIFVVAPGRLMCVYQHRVEYNQDNSLNGIVFRC